jgi:hypothetical protein
LAIDYRSGVHEVLEVLTVVTDSEDLYKDPSVLQGGISYDAAVNRVAGATLLIALLATELAAERCTDLMHEVRSAALHLLSDPPE